MRETILNELKRLAKAQNGQAPGSRLFERETGIRESAWRGVYWARWGDAVREAGLQPNSKVNPLDKEFMLRRLAEACRHFGKFPTAMEIRLYRKGVSDFPNVKTIARHFGSYTRVPEQLGTWAAASADYQDVAGLLRERTAPTEDSPAGKEGLVYLIRSGAFYKVGRSDELERRVKQIRIALPEAAALIHAIKTDDPPGIEAYWHRRFADKRANGEWFRLATTDVNAFKRRKFQ